jgi:RNA polymerase sigma factor for flagellar operon FliA
MTEPFDTAPKTSTAPETAVCSRAAVLRGFALSPAPRLASRRGGRALLAAAPALRVPTGVNGDPRGELHTEVRAPAPTDTLADAPATVLGPRARAAARKAVVGEALYPTWRAYWKDGRDRDRNHLVEAYQELVREIVGRFAARLPRKVDRGDLATAGNVGLIAAITSFDADRCVRFEAYADRRIRGALLDELRCQDWMPRPWRQRFEQHKRAVERLRSALGREPQDHETAEQLGITIDEYVATYAVGLPGSPASARATDDADDHAAGLDVVPDTRTDTPEERLTRDELIGLVTQRLTVQEYRIVHLKYWEDLPMRVIGELTSLSESRVCKIHSRLIERLRDRLGASS